MAAERASVFKAFEKKKLLQFPGEGCGLVEGFLAAASPGVQAARGPTR
jgi:hypothetical protein